VQLGFNAPNVIEVLLMFVNGATSSTPIFGSCTQLEGFEMVKMEEIDIENGHFLVRMRLCTKNLSLH
jgi:hypothetical protein